MDGKDCRLLGRQPTADSRQPYVNGSLSVSGCCMDLHKAASWSPEAIGTQQQASGSYFLASTAPWRPNAHSTSVIQPGNASS